jgi:hypothetical protein
LNQFKTEFEPRRPALCWPGPPVGTPTPRCLTYPSPSYTPPLTSGPVAARPHLSAASAPRRPPRPPFSPSPSIVWHARADPLPCLTPPLLQKVPAATPAPSFSPFSLAHGHMSSTPSFPASSPSRMSRNELPSAAFLSCPRHLHPPW